MLLCCVLKQARKLFVWSVRLRVIYGSILSYLTSTDSLFLHLCSELCSGNINTSPSSQAEYQLVFLSIFAAV